MVSSRTAAKTIADGSDLLLEVLHPGVIGGFVIPLLGALPDALIILVSGMGTREEVQEEIVCRPHPHLHHGFSLSSL